MSRTAPARNSCRPSADTAPQPIVPDYTYPIDALRQWGFGARGRATLISKGLRVMRFGRTAFFLGQDLVDVLAGKRGPAASPQPDASCPQPLRE